MEEGIPYIGFLTHQMSLKKIEPITKNLTDYIRAGEGTATVKDTINFLLKGKSEFPLEQRNIADLIDEDIRAVEGDRQRYFLGIRLRDDKGDFRDIPAVAQRSGENPSVVFVLETALTAPLFEKYSKLDGDYIGLYLVCVGPITGGRNK